jgi:TonB family protein
MPAKHPGTLALLTLGSLLLVPNHVMAEGATTTPPEAGIEAARGTKDHAALLAFVGQCLKEVETGDSQSLFVAGLASDLGIGAPLDRAIAQARMEKAASRGNLLAKSYLSWRKAVDFGTNLEGRTDESTFNARLARARALKPCPVIPKGMLAELVSTKGGPCVPLFEPLKALLLDEAEAGDAVAMHTVAMHCLSPFWGTPDFRLHQEWLLRAAGKGNNTARLRLAFYEKNGAFGPPNAEKVRHWLRLAATDGDSESQYALALDLGGEEGNDASHAEALQWCRKAASNGARPPLLLLISYLRNGLKGVPADKVEARKLATTALESGREPELLLSHAEMLCYGEGGPTDAAGAELEFLEAARQGSVHAMRQLGWLYKGTALGAPQPEKALAWFEEGAGLGNAECMAQMGWLLTETPGIPHDNEKAFVWFEKAAREGNANAQNRLGWMLRNGCGCTLDQEEAVTWFKLAWEHGEPWAAANLGYHYLFGYGVKRDELEACNHLVAAQKALVDDWSASFLVQLMEIVRKKDGPVVRRFYELIDEPGLLDLPGSLPETSCAALSGIGTEEALQRKTTLLAQLEKANRVQASEQLATCLFLGDCVPYDPTKALAFAHRIVDPKRRAMIADWILLTAAETENERKRALGGLEMLCRNGYAPAQALLAACYHTGEGVPLDPDFAELVRKGEDPSYRKLPPRSPGLLSMEERNLDAKLGQALAKAPKNAEPRPLHKAPVLWPASFSSRWAVGKVVLSVLVDEAGQPQDITVVSSTQPLLTESLLRSVRKWRFVPGLVDGVRSPMRLEIAQEYSVNALRQGSITTQP